MIRVKLSALTANDDINIYIDDSIHGWKNGQLLKLVFENKIAMDGNNINFFTNKIGGWEQVAQIIGAELPSQRPYVELVCTDKVNLTFVTDVLR